ncbi:hypothetical protein WKI68_24025 [Streptomyces sp. MS1.HAVA.3]|uniref:Uncharacterized protein n=1 Tax=Streptomyces caledonius TaxID=3134107 RepID=A0ABU8U8X7_9ACTN
MPDLAFGIHQVILDGEAKEDGTPVTSVVLVKLDTAGESQARTSYQGRVEEIADALDRAGCQPRPAVTACGPSAPASESRLGTTYSAT